MENTCKTCINNDDGLCDRKGILVEDEDSCEHHWAAGKKIRMKRREKKMDITPELMLSAYNTLIQGCKSRPASEDGICSRCILYQRCPHIDNAIPADWEEIHYPYLEGNTLHYIKAGKNNQHVLIVRYVGHEHLHWSKLCYVRKDHRILPAKCSVLAEADASVKRIFHHGSQGR